MVTLATASWVSVKLWKVQHTLASYLNYWSVFYNVFYANCRWLRQSAIKAIKRRFLYCNTLFPTNFTWQQPETFSNYSLSFLGRPILSDHTTFSDSYKSVILFQMTFYSGYCNSKCLTSYWQYSLWSKHTDSHLNCMTRRHDNHTWIQADAQG